MNLTLHLDQRFEDALTDEAVVLGEITIREAIVRALMLWLRLRRLERQGAHLFIGHRVGELGAMRFERLEGL